MLNDLWDECFFSVFLSSPAFPWNKKLVICLKTSFKMLLHNQWLERSEYFLKVCGLHKVTLKIKWKNCSVYEYRYMVLLPTKSALLLFLIFPGKNPNYDTPPYFNMHISVFIYLPIYIVCAKYLHFQMWWQQLSYFKKLTVIKSSFFFLKDNK